MLPIESGAVSLIGIADSPETSSNVYRGTPRVGPGAKAADR